MNIMTIVHWVQDNWLTVGLSVIALDNFLVVISPITPWKWDDTVASRLQDIVKKFWPGLKQ